MKNVKPQLLLILTFLIYANSLAQIGFQDHIVVDDSYTTNRVMNIYLADIDGDGDVDLLSASQFDDKIAWHENTDGQGTFGLQQIITTDANGAQAVFAIDIDGDGDMDVLSGSQYDNKIAWYENTDGQGTFGSPQIITTNASHAQFIFAADIDGDGDTDVLSTSIWYENDGQGNFSLAQGISGGGIPYLADIDNDGDMDALFASTNGSGKIVWCENTDGQGNFGLPQTITTEAIVSSSLYAIDIDGDGDMDVVSSSRGDNKIAWYENIDGQGNFGQQQIITTTAKTVTSIYPADIDQDGDIDILSGYSETNSLGGGDTIKWYKNIDGQGTFVAQQVISANVDNPESVFAIDINSDGNIDVLSASSDDNKIAWYENTDGQGNFGQQQLISTNMSYGNGGAESICTTDFDDDNDIDILVAFRGEIVWYENINGLGDFNIQHLVTNEELQYIIGSTDIDNDGDMDIISVSRENVSWSNYKLGWYENINGQGNFGMRQIISDSVGGVVVVSMCTTDVDNDGDMDIVLASQGNDKITWYENIDGQGNFDTEKIIAASTDGVVSIFVIDVDGDGDTDVLSASQNDNKIAWYKNIDGQGNFGTEQVITTFLESASSVYAIDIDGDGDVDVLSTSGNGNVAWYENIDGQGNFGIEQIITTVNGTDVNGFSERHLVFATDIDGDSDVDIFSSFYWNDKIDWIENIDGLGNYGTLQPVTTSTLHTKSISIADIDNDGDMDVISLSSLNHPAILWHENLGISTHKINGIVHADTNINGCDTLDVLIPSLMVVTDNGDEYFSTFTKHNGLYQLFPDEGEYTTTIIPPNSFVVTPSFHTSNFVGVGNVDIADFCLQPNQPFNDLNITIVPSQARSGFDAIYRLVFHNVGTTELSGSIALDFDDAKLTFLSASETIATQISGMVTFDYSDLSPFETRTIDLQFHVNVGTIGAVLNFTATITPVAGDYTEEDNVFAFDQVVIGSYDPNDITVLEGNEISIEDVNRYLHYVIRFQNTGTADAINVKVNNILDENLDWNTLQLENISHANRVEIKNGKEVSFIFDGIHLPDSTMNEPNSHGFISYKIKPKTGVAVSTIISNKADVFFDFNVAVETNTVTTEIVAPTSITQNTFLPLSIYPVPTSDILIVKSGVNITQIEIYNRLGQLVLSNSGKNKIDLSSLNCGLYFCKIKNKNGEEGIKKVVKE